MRTREGERGGTAGELVCRYNQEQFIRWLMVFPETETNTMNIRVFSFCLCPFVVECLHSSSRSLCRASDGHQRAHQRPGQSWHPSFGLQDVRHEGPFPRHRGSSCPPRAGGKRREPGSEEQRQPAGGNAIRKGSRKSK